MASPYANTDQGYQDYVNSKNNAGQWAQGAFNTLSNPFSNLFGNNAAANNSPDGLGTFTNPLGLNFTGGEGGWNQDLANNPAVFKSMTDADWAAFSKMSSADQSAFVKTRAAQLPTDGQISNQQMIINQVEQFAQQMNMPVDQLLKNDSFAQALNASTYENAQKSALGSGLGAGGISQQNADLASKQALLGYQMQRQQAGQQALNTAFNMNTTQQQVNLQLQQLTAASQAQQFAQGQAQAGNTLGIVGGVVGGIYGGPTGAAAGQKLGSGLGSASYGSYTPYSYSNPQSYSAGGFTGGGSPSSSNTGGGISGQSGNF